MDQEQDRKTDTSLPRLISTSYIYPVKSLLEGRIQPVAGPSRTSDDVASSSNQKACSPVDPSPSNSSSHGTNSSQLKRGTSPPELMAKPRGKGTRPRAASASIARRLPTDNHETKPEGPSTKSRQRKPVANGSHTFSQISAEDTESYIPRIFTTARASDGTPDPASSAIAHLDIFHASMSAEHLLGHLNTNPPRDICNSTPPHLPSSDDSPPADGIVERPDNQPTRLMEKQQQPISSFAIPPEVPHPDTLSTPLAKDLGCGSRRTPPDEDEEDLPFNPSEYGFVHLPPLLPSRSNTNSDRGSTHNSFGHRSRASERNSKMSSLPRESIAGSNENRDYSASAPVSEATSSRQSQQEFSSEVFASQEDASVPYVSFRYRSAEDQNGNHVVVGREGILHRCEDEPIRTPGAVQGFGVLIAVEELEDALVVRQVSENSTELLGLSPQYLFSLECFTDTLPEAQAAILWDNVEFLSDPDLQSEDGETKPHVFLLNGWGAPGSSLSQNADAVDGKRPWACWCAVHRTEGYSSSSAVSPGLIIMEFELERDLLNPLYPPIVVPSGHASGVVSPLASGLDALDKTSQSRDNQQSPDIGSDQSTAGKATVMPSMRSSATPEPAENSTSSQDDWRPSAKDIIESTTSSSKPMPALERLRRMTRGSMPYGNTVRDGKHVDPLTSLPEVRHRRRHGSRSSAAVGMMDVFAVMAQINEQIGSAPNLESFLKVVVGVIKDLTQFHRVMTYQFDELWNGQVEAELVDWSQSHDLFKGLHFPAEDIPAQARQLYASNKVRLLYDVSQTTARIVVRSKDDLQIPLNMTHCYLRAMSPIHITYLQNMGVRASMSISLMVFGKLWGLIMCHTYGSYGMRVSFPVRQMLGLLSQSISKNIERLSYAQRLYTRKLINTVTSSQQPSGYIISTADDLLGLFDAEFGILVIGDGAKILGPNQHGQEILIMAEYLRLKQFDTIQASQAVIKDFPDLELTTGFEIIAGLLYVPLSSGGKDFIAFLRRGQPHEVRWAGRPFKDDQGGSSLEPRKSFKIWSETVAGRCKIWTEEQLETAGVLALVYGKFIQFWREKEEALQTTKITNLLLSNASHEVRTPLNHIINYLEMAMNGPLDKETHANLKKSHRASKSLLFTINDLLDLTHLESGNETCFNESFDLHFAIDDATRIYRNEARRRQVDFFLEVKDSPTMVVGDVKKIRTVVQNLTANALKYTTSGSITVSCSTFSEPKGLRRSNQTAVEIVVADTGCGIFPDKLESIFRDFERVESSEPAKSNSDAGVGFGLAVVARIVEQLGGQLRVDSTVNKGSRFSFLIPLALSGGSSSRSAGTVSSSDSSRASPGVSMRSRSIGYSSRSGDSDIENLVHALSPSHHSSRSNSDERFSIDMSSHRPPLNPFPSSASIFDLTGSHIPINIDAVDADILSSTNPGVDSQSSSQKLLVNSSDGNALSNLRVLIVEDNDINRILLAKRLKMNGHIVVNTTNGQEGLDRVMVDRAFDAILMDIQMPILNGFEATRRIRDFETKNPTHSNCLSHSLNGRIPIFAVSASLEEQQCEELAQHGMDGWILKPIDFKRLGVILKGVTDMVQRCKDVYHIGCNWEAGGWLKEPPPG